MILNELLFINFLCPNERCITYIFRENLGTDNIREGFNKRGKVCPGTGGEGGL